MSTQEELNQLSEQYKNLKARAYELYYDPIDFPKEVKYELQWLSHKKGELRRQLNPEKELEKQRKQWKREDTKRKEMNKKIKALKKDILSKYPNYNILEKNVDYLKHNKTQQKALDTIQSYFPELHNVTAIWTFVRTIRAEIKDLKQSQKITGRIF